MKEHSENDREEVTKEGKELRLYSAVGMKRGDGFKIKSTLNTAVSDQVEKGLRKGQRS